MKTTSIGINKWASGMKIYKSWELGTGDNRLVGWVRDDGQMAIETNGDPIHEWHDGFWGVWGGELELFGGAR